MFNIDIQTLSIGFGFLIIWLFGVSFFLYRNISHYNRLIGKAKKENLKEILEKILKEVKISKKEIENLRIKIAEIEKEALFHIQKIGLLKFNPFKDIGGEQSFTLSLLNKKDTGVVITALHSRETTRFYVKKIKKGKGADYELSREEIEAIKEAGKL